MSGEREAIESAIDRLLAGTPLRSTGSLSVVQLVIEAGVQRWRLYPPGPDADLREKFEALVAGRSRSTPREADLSARLAEERRRSRALRAKNKELRARVDAYAQIIVDLQDALESQSGSPARVVDLTARPRR